MIRLKPNPEAIFRCPECRSEDTIVHDIRFESINILADCTCPRCGFEFYQALPVGHTVNHPLSIGKQNGKIHSRDESPHWVINAVLQSHENNRLDVVKIERTIFKKYDKVIILNALDSLYGHVLLKIYNAFHHLDHQKDLGLILIIPKLVKWLVPQGCAEIWVVDLPLADLDYGYDSIRKYIGHELERFEQVYLSKAYSHPDVSKVDFARLTGVSPFDLENFSRQKATVTFVLREDRWWFNGTMDYWFYRACRKLRVLSFGAKLLTLRQNRLIKKTMALIRKDLHVVDFFVIGLGRTGEFGKEATDHRQTTVNAVIESSWCRTYSKSHVVVGIHGSNMLLPTAMAAGCVEILPEDRYGNMIQDLSVRYNDRRQLFFYRLADQFATPKSIGDKVVGIIRDYEEFHTNMCQNGYARGVL